MKKLLLVILMIPAISSATHKEAVEDSIIESDLKATRSLLNANDLNEVERYSLFKLAKKILRQKRSLFSLIFPTYKEIINTVKCLGISAAGATVAGLYTSAVALIYTQKYNSCPSNSAMSPGIAIASLAFAGAVTSLSIIGLKHIYDWRKSWINAIAIKTMLEKREDKETNTHNSKVRVRLM